jgi:lysophospholipase L1-like esterase
MKRVLIVLAIVAVAVIAFQLLVADRQPTNAIPTGETIVCFGDSLTWGTGAEPAENYPAHLEGLIGSSVINAGVPGDTTARALARLEEDVLAHSPRIVLITLGGNDFKNGVQAQIAFANLEQIVTTIHDHGALVVLGGIDIPLFDRGFTSGYDDVADSTGCVLVPNVFKGIMGKRQLMSDRIHPNGDGYAVMAGHFHRAVEPFL